MGNIGSHVNIYLGAVRTSSEKGSTANIHAIFSAPKPGRSCAPGSVSANGEVVVILAASDVTGVSRNVSRPDASVAHYREER